MFNFRQIGNLQSFDGEGDALGFGIGGQHFHFYDLADLDRVVRIFDEASGEFADVHQAILVNADIDEGAESSDVGDDAFERHAGGEIRYLSDGGLELRSNELCARIAAGLAEFFAGCP